MSTTHVRKTRAGTDSAGHHWPEDGAVIEVPVEHALVLARIPDGGFAIVENFEPEAPAEIEVPAETAPSRPASARASRAKAEDQAASK